MSFGRCFRDVFQWWLQREATLWRSCCLLAVRGTHWRGDQQMRCKWGAIFPGAMATFRKRVRLAARASPERRECRWLGVRSCAPCM